MIKISKLQTLLCLSVTNGLKMGILYGMLLLVPTVEAQDGNGNLWFESGFEPPVVVEQTEFDRYDISGSDGMDWRTDFEDGSPVSSMNFSLTGGTAGEDANIDLVPDPENPANQVLRFENIKDGSDRGTSRTQVECGFESDFTQGFMRYKMYLDEESVGRLQLYPNRVSWFTIMEWWEARSSASGGDVAGRSRVTWGLFKEDGANSPLYWSIQHELRQSGRGVTWREDNNDVAVPIGEWFLLEVFFKLGDENNGRLWSAITLEGGERQVLWDVNDRTQHPEDPQRLRGWQFLKLYTSGSVLDFIREGGTPATAYYDDYEFWDDFPPASVKE